MRTTLIRRKIGTDESGNFGHAGRPGKVGGSRTSASLEPHYRRPSTSEYQREQSKKRVEQKSSQYLTSNLGMTRIEVLEAEETWNNVAPNHPANMQFGQFLQQAFGYEYTLEDGRIVRVKPQQVQMNSMERNKLEVYGKVYLIRPGSDYEEIVGRWNRDFTLDKVYNASFSMDSSHQGLGIGAELYRRAEDVYRKAGFKQITVSANISVGGYAWARMGFDFAENYDRREFARQLDYRIKELKADKKLSWDNPPSLRSLEKYPAWKMAALTAPDGTKVGKSFMLDRSWHGIKYLDPKWKGYKVGQMYYDVKAGKKKQ